MKNLRIVGTLLIGLIVGILATSSVTVRGQRNPGRERNPARFTSFATVSGQPASTANLFFVGDTQSPGCWLAVLDGTGTGVAAIAVAPAEACK